MLLSESQLRIINKYAGQAMLKYRVAALREATHNYDKGEIVPTKPGSKVFYFDGDVWLVEFLAENEVRADAGYEVVKLFKHIWQFIGIYGKNMVLYRLIPWRE